MRALRPRAGRSRSLRRALHAFQLVGRAAPGLLAASVVVMILGGALPTAAAWSQRAIVDAVVGHAIGEDAALGWVAVFGAVGVLTAVTTAVRLPLEALVRRRIEAVTSDRLFAAVCAVHGLERFENPAYLDQLRLAQQAGATAPGSLVTSALAGCQSVLVAVGLVGAVASVSVPLAALVVAAALPSIAAQQRLSRHRIAMNVTTAPLIRRRMFHTSLLTSGAAAKEIRLFGLGGLLRTRLRADLAAVQRAEGEQDLRTLRTQTALAVLAATVSAGALWWVVRLAYAGRMSVGDVTLSIAALAGLQAAVAAGVDRIAEIHQATAMLGFYLDVVLDDVGDADANANADTHADTHTHTHTDAHIGRRSDAAPPPLTSAVEFHDVWFRYDPAQPWVLRGLDLRLEAGEATALVGLNGAGKSTLVKLLCRFYDPQQGSITWDGVDLRDLDPASLRDRIGAVFQDPMHYDFTIGDNIGVGDVARIDDTASIRHAAALAGVAELAESAPHGYRTLVSRIFFGASDSGDPETGIALSGGQWQRLALARGLMRAGRDLLILDEPGTGLDADSEAATHRTLRDVRTGRTSVLISHRLSAVKDADVIAVLADGAVIEHGTHAELMDQDTEYRRLFELQASGYLEAETGTETGTGDVVLDDGDRSSGDSGPLPAAGEGAALCGV